MRLVLTILTFMLIAIQPAGALVLSPDDMAEAVRREFVEQGLGDNVEVEFFGGQTEFAFEGVKDAKIMVSYLEVEEEQNKFTAEAEIFADGKPVEKTKLFGRYFVMTEIWVPIKDIEKDKIIRSEDLKKVVFRSNRLREGTVGAKESLLGKQALRLIKEGKPIMLKDIRDEVLIKRGQTVLAVYRHKGLQIMTKMEAQEDGARGQRIKLLNTKSGKEVVGKVVDKNMVEIAAE